MFTPKNIQGALEELYDLCDPDYMVDMLVNYSEEFDDISPALLAKSFQKNAEMVSEYRVLSSAGEGIDYQGTVLLNSRAVRLLSYVEDMSGDEKVRTILMMVMAAQPVIGMPPGEVVAVFKKIHAPDGIALPVTFMLRFFPTVRSEFSDVFASLRLRKLLSWKHPLDAMEYIVTPVIFRSSRIAEELAASAESRGISNPGKHTCRRKIEFQKRDWIMCVIAVCVTVLYFMLERTVA